MVTPQSSNLVGPVEWFVLQLWSVLVEIVFTSVVLPRFIVAKPSVINSPSNRCGSKRGHLHGFWASPEMEKYTWTRLQRTWRLPVGNATIGGFKPPQQPSFSIFGDGQMLFDCLAGGKKTKKTTQVGVLCWHLTSSQHFPWLLHEPSGCWSARSSRRGASCSDETLRAMTYQKTLTHFRGL